MFQYHLVTSFSSNRHSLISWMILKSNGIWVLKMMCDVNCNFQLVGLFFFLFPLYYEQVLNIGFHFLLSYTECAVCIITSWEWKDELWLKALGGEKNWQAAHDMDHDSLSEMPIHVFVGSVVQMQILQWRPFVWLRQELCSKHMDSILCIMIL